MSEFKMMCIQPIRIDSNVYTNMIDNAKFFESVEKNIEGHEFGIDWLDNFTDKYRKFRSFKPIKLPEDLPNSDLLLNDFANEQFKVGGKVDIGEYFIPEKSRVALLYDHRFFNFFIVYEFAFLMPDEILIQSLSYSLENQLKTDLYNTLRRMLVKEDKHSKISTWGESVRTKLLACVDDITKCSSKTVKLNNQKTAVMIGKNTGNITFYYKAGSQSDLKQAILQCNAGAESIKRDVIPVIDDNNLCYCFFGRFHSIISTDENHYYRYFPIQFHMQFMWFITGFYLEILEKLNDDVNSNSSSDFIKKRLDDVDSYVNQIQFLLMHNEKFKLTIEADHELILSKIEKNWNIEKSLNNAAQYVSIFKEYLSKRHTKKQEKATQRQNTILFLISCIQIIALLSVWADYLSITNPTSLPSAGPLIEKFNDTTSLMTINLWLPAGLSVAVLLITLFGFLRRK